MAVEKTNKVMKRMSACMRLRNLSPSTQELYKRAVLQLLEYHQKPVEKIKQNDVTDFFLHLREERKLSPSSINVYHAGLKFLFHNALGRQNMVKTWQNPRRKYTLPAVCNRSQIIALLNSIDSIVYRTIFLEEINKDYIRTARRPASRRSGQSQGGGYRQCEHAHTCSPGQRGERSGRQDVQYPTLCAARVLEAGQATEALLISRPDGQHPHQPRRCTYRPQKCGSTVWVQHSGNATHAETFLCHPPAAVGCGCPSDPRPARSSLHPFDPGLHPGDAGAPTRCQESATVVENGHDRVAAHATQRSPCVCADKATAI